MVKQTALLVVLFCCGCKIHLVGAKEPMALGAPPWNAPPPDHAAEIVPLQKQCRDHVEQLRADAEDALHGREVRRLVVALTSTVVGGVGIGLAASSATPGDVKAVTGYVVTGLGLTTQAIDAVIPSNRAEALYAAWRRAAEYYDAAEERLGLINACTDFEDPLAHPMCVGLDAEVKPAAPQGAVAIVTNTQEETVRERFRKLHGVEAVQTLRKAYRTCAGISAMDFEKK